MDVDIGLQVAFRNIPVVSLVSSSFSGIWRHLMEEVLVTEAEDPENPEECVASQLSSIIGLKQPQMSQSS